MYVLVCTATVTAPHTLHVLGPVLGPVLGAPGCRCFALGGHTHTHTYTHTGILGLLTLLPIIHILSSAASQSIPNWRPLPSRTPDSRSSAPAIPLASHPLGKLLEAPLPAARSICSFHSKADRPTPPSIDPSPRGTGPRRLPSSSD